jgi:hypothetical protein
MVGDFVEEERRKRVEREGILESDGEGGISDVVLSSVVIVVQCGDDQCGYAVLITHKMQWMWVDEYSIVHAVYLSYGRLYIHALPVIPT